MSQKPILYAGLLFLTLLAVFPAQGARAAATDQVTEAQKSELTSQTEAFRKAPKLEAPGLPEKPQIVTEEKKELPTEEAGPIFLIKKVEFWGNTLFTDKDFKPYVDPYLNRKVSFSELKSLARAVTNHYRSHGFTTSRAYVPPQTIENATAMINIVEGKVDKVVVEGNRYFAAALYEEAIRLRKDKIFRYQDLETSLYALNLKPDRKVRAYLMPGTEPAASDIVLKTEETYPVHVSYEFNNHGTKLTHLGRHLIHVDDNNLTGHDDILNTSVSLAEEGAFDAWSMNYSLPIRYTDTTFNLEAAYADSLLIGPLRPFNVQGESLNITPGFTHTFIAKPELLLEGYAGFEIKDSTTTIDKEKTSFDRMRVVKAGPRLTLRDGSGRTMIEPQIHWGIPDFLGSLKASDPSASVPNSGGDFVYYTLSASRIQRLPLSSFLIVHGSAQWAFDTLTSLEEYRAGGAYSVRGYPESDAQGDSGYSLSTEINVPASFFPGDWRMPFTHEKWSDTIKLAAFLDIAKTYYRERITSETVKDRLLIGTGVGFRIGLGKNFFLQTDLGFPIGDEPSDKSDKRVHIALTGGF